MLNLMLGNSISLFGTLPGHFQYDIYRLINLQNPKQEVTQKSDGPKQK